MKQVFGFLLLICVIACSKDGGSPSGSNGNPGNGNGGNGNGGNGNGGNNGNPPIQWNVVNDSINIGSINTVAGLIKFTCIIGRTATLSGNGNWNMELYLHGKGSVAYRTSTSVQIKIDPSSAFSTANTGSWSPDANVHPHIRFFDSTQKKMINAFFFNHPTLSGNMTVTFIGNNLPADSLLMKWKETHRDAQLTIGN